ncbi:PD-(D/E)XK nuclease family protein [Companilactobacillus sp. HBUAS56257]|uniref:PD-(D/E)XK nuclease family protein n=1 Tax=Companilactobacillus sp. HBUAS56257 TaxID=3109360 RepID=UPI002FF38184
MTLNFVLGKNQFDHHQKMMELFSTDYQKDPEGQFFFLVPNHIKFESEVNILRHFEKDDQTLAATHNVQTFSFSRLAWYFLRDTSEYNLETLSQTKSAMLLKDIVAENKSDLKIFAGMIDKPGFIDQMISQFNEFMNGQVQPDDIELALNNNQEGIFTDKIKELNLMYDSYLQRIQDYQTNDFQLNALADFLNTKIGTSHYYFYIEGFSSFTATEANLVKSMLVNGGSLNISLVMEKPVLKDDDLSEFYYRPGKTYQQLHEFAKQKQIITRNVFANVSRVSSDLQKLENYWIESSVGNIKKSGLDSQNSVQIWKCTDKQTEVSAISTYIRQLVATQNYRYKDFLILARDLSEYGSFIESFMENNQVPYFIDLQKKMANHPFKRLIDLLFAIVNKGMQTDDIISLLRTELLIPEVFENDLPGFRQAIDLAENYALTNGLTKRAWLGDDFEPEVKLDPVVDKIRIHEYELVNIIKNFVSQIYSQLDKFLKKSHTSLESVSFLYNFLEQNHVFDNLLVWQKQATEDNNLTLANQPEQIVNLFNQILDEYVSVFGEREFNAKDFIAILDAAFENATYSQIPSNLDSVSISEIGMIQPTDRKITFILGSTTNNMPGTTVSNDIVTDDERQFLNGEFTDGKYLNEPDEVMNNSEPFLHDLTFTTSLQRLIFTYPNFTEDNKQQDLSSYVVRIKNHFRLDEQNILLNPVSSDVGEDQVIKYLGSKASSLNYLIRVSRCALDNKTDLPDAWKYVRSVLLNEEPTTSFALSSLDYQNIPYPLEPATVEALYGKNINVSISQLETFYMNEYEYFLKYGLRLRPRRLFEVTPAQTGSIFHAVLDSLVKFLHEEPNRSLRNLEDGEIENLVSDLFDSQLLLPENRIFTTSSRMQYISDKLKTTLIQLVKNMKLQFLRNNSEPEKSEVTFGRLNHKQDLPGLSYEISGGHKINVRGKIDRIDEMVLDNLTYLTIIDYKSGNKSFDFAQFLEGITMQMPTYIQSVYNNLNLLSESTNTKIGGALYEHIQNPLIPIDKSLINKKDFDAKILNTDIQNKVFKKFQLNGLLLNDENLLANIDLEARTSKGAVAKTSPVVKKSDGNLVTEQDLFKILNYNQHLIKQAGEKIYSGKLSLNPYRYGRNTGLQYSDYRPVFEFDAMLPENEYHDIVNYHKEDVIKEIQAILEDGEEDA